MPVPGQCHDHLLVLSKQGLYRPQDTDALGHVQGVALRPPHEPTGVAHARGILMSPPVFIFHYMPLNQPRRYGQEAVPSSTIGMTRPTRTTLDSTIRSSVTIDGLPSRVNG